MSWVGVWVLRKLPCCSIDTSLVLLMIPQVAIVEPGVWMEVQGQPDRVDRWRNHRLGVDFKKEESQGLHPWAFLAFIWHSSTESDKTSIR